jgi:hypothetical protein
MQLEQNKNYVHYLNKIMLLLPKLGSTCSKTNSSYCRNIFSEQQNDFREGFQLQTIFAIKNIKMKSKKWD